MAGYIGNLQDGGPVIPVKLRPAGMLKQLAPFIDSFATIDTAYPFNFIQEGLATRLGLKPVRRARITTPTKFASECEVYTIHIELPNGHTVQLDVAEVPFLVNNVRFGCLLGRAFLKTCNFTYNGPASSFTLEYKR